MRGLSGRVVLVTGGASGIGAAVATRLQESGAIAVVADLSVDAASVGRIHLDVADPESCAVAVRSVLALHGRLDGLVNSAGIGADIDFLDTPVAIFDRVIAVNLRGSFLIGQAAARAMCAGGSIVMISSVSGLRGNVGRAAYGASKAGIINLVQVMAVELASQRIRVNALAPGPVETPLSAALHDPGIRAGWTSVIPMTRYGSAEEISAVAAFLLSDESAYVTGQVLAADGGFTASGVRRTQPAR